MKTSSGKRVPKAARGVAAGAIALLAVHMFFTGVYNTPYTDLKYQVLPGAAADQYVRPYLVQDYKIFAPDPVDTDRQLWVRAWVETPGGERTRSEWVNASAVELAEPYRRTLRKQLSVVGAERLMATYRALSEEQQQVASKNHLDGDELYGLRDALVAADDSNRAEVRAFIRATNYTASYATQVAHAMWGDAGDVQAVQVRAVYDPVIRWADRHDPDAERPPAKYTDLGWVPAMEWPGQDREAFARSFRSWADKAGVEAGLEPAGVVEEEQGE
ncbi:DUF5819 family protein [Leucobacter aridicollis]|uniref:DUF5819 family protein n=1 Tax=Leucobacter aridicollis TaxID=283878 RepID=UPI00210262D7|nr:DUF5819 family protein [Leucobacter aridicollis]UTX52573.1 hypothetical protein KI794_12650 [Leucobacter aridicollis]